MMATRSACSRLPFEKEEPVRNRGVFAVGLLILVLCASPSLAAGEPAKSPTQAYLDYHAAVLKARTLSEVLPYLSAEYRGMLGSKPKKDHPVLLERLKETANVKDLKIGRETIAGDKCTLEGTATSARGNAVHGKVNLVREGGAWKLDEEFWTT
jgi:hypothetical protein